MREIRLTTGQKTLVDDEMYECLNQWKWRAGSDNYVIRWQRGSWKKGNKPKLVFMHRVILNTPRDKISDHIDGNRLNNQRKNLRICNHSQNTANAISSGRNKSGYRGVSWSKEVNKWVVYISKDNKNYYVGYYEDKHEAAMEYNKIALLLYKEFATLNEIRR